MPALTPCPDVHTLKRILGSDSQEPQDDQLRGHLNDCPRCAHVLEEEDRADPLLSKLRQPSQVLNTFVSVEFPADLLEKIRNLPVLVPDRRAAANDVLTSLRPAQAPGELGRLGPYAIYAIVGQGGMGVVFRARHLQLKRAVALKILQPYLTGSGEGLKRFLNEVQVLAALDHPNVVRLHEIGADNGVHYLAMKFIAGETLDARIKRENKLSVRTALRICREIALGLEAIHAPGVIHRDIKSSNIILEQETDQVQILDLGLAKPGFADDLQLTHSLALLGTAAFMSLEQATTPRQVTTLTDLYSLGAVLYHAVTGQLPYTGRDAFDVIAALRQGPPPPPEKVCPDLPKDVGRLIGWLMARQVEDRPHGARQVVEEIDRILEVPQPAPPLPRRRGRWIAVAAALLLTALPFLFYCGPAVIRIATNKGVLVVEANDKDIEVKIKGEQVTLIDAKEKRAFTLTAGEDYLVEVRELPSGVVVTTRTFRLTRNGQETVKVELAPNQVAPAPKKEPVVESPPSSPLVTVLNDLRLGKKLLLAASPSRRTAASSCVEMATNCWSGKGKPEANCSWTRALPNIRCYSPPFPQMARAWLAAAGTNR